MVAFPTKFNYGRGNYHTRIVLWEIDSPSHVTYRSSQRSIFSTLSCKSSSAWDEAFKSCNGIEYGEYSEPGRYRRVSRLQDTSCSSYLDAPRLAVIEALFETNLPVRRWISPDLKGGGTALNLSTKLHGPTNKDIWRMVNLPNSWILMTVDEYARLTQLPRVEQSQWIVARLSTLVMLYP
jgi:hypothetical protein